MPEGDGERRVHRRWRGVCSHRSEVSASLLNTIRALVLALRRDGTIVLFNRSCENATGYSAREVVNRRPWEFLVAAEDVDSERESFENVLHLSFRTEREVTWICKDGGRRIISWSNALEHDCLGEGEDMLHSRGSRRQGRNPRLWRNLAFPGSRTTSPMTNRSAWTVSEELWNVERSTLRPGRPAWH